MEAEIKVDSTSVLLAIDDLSEEVDRIIADEVHSLHRAIVKKGYDVWDTGNFLRKIRVPSKTREGWRIPLRAKYSSILWRGRRTIGGRAYGSLKWAGGGQPMLKKTERNIIRRADDVRV